MICVKIGWALPVGINVLLNNVAIGTKCRWPVYTSHTHERHSSGEYCRPDAEMDS